METKHTSTPKLECRKIREWFVVGYWKPTPHSYWSDKLWEPLHDYALETDALKHVDAINA